VSSTVIALLFSELISGKHIPPNCALDLIREKKYPAANGFPLRREISNGRRNWACAHLLAPSHVMMAITRHRDAHGGLCSTMRGANIHIFLRKCSCTYHGCI
jgi:hypothetical protein